MNAVKSTLAVLLAFMPIIAFSQDSRFRQRLDVAEAVEDEGAVKLEVFRMPDVGQYYLSVGTVGVGDEIIQVELDPLTELFIPLGSDLTEAMETLDQLLAMYKQPKNTSIEIPGCLGLIYPGEDLEPVKVKYMKVLLSNLLEFSVQRETHIRATHIPRSAFKSLMVSMKIHRKLHPKD